MGFFDPNSGNNNGTPADQPTPSSKMQLRDASGKIITSVPLNDGRGQYTRTLTANNIGQNTLGAYFPGDNRFAGSGADSFNSHVADANGNNATKGIFDGVKQIVAGSGIYISSNGQGIVTISTIPVDSSIITEDIFDVQWGSKDYINPPTSTQPGEFIAVGRGGVTARSRDGHNWIKLPYPDHPVSNFSGVEVAWDSQISPYGITYDSVYFNTLTNQTHVATGFAGRANDQFTNDYALYDQNGSAISTPLDVLYRYPTQTSFEYIWVGQGKIGHNQYTYDFSTSTTATVWIETVQLGKYFNQVAASNTSSSNAFIAIAPFYNYNTSTGATIAGGGIVLSNRNGQTTSTWNTVYTDSTVNLRGSAYGNGVWISCGSDNTVVRSTNGSSWTKSSGAVPGATWWYMAYGNGKFVCVGYTTVNGQQVAALQYSTDDGVTWTKGSPGTTNRLYGITYSPELNVFVACGLGGALVSVDG